MEDCIFCQIIAKKIPANIVYENGHSIAFLDINPINKGHCLVVPKEHHHDLYNMPKHILHDMIDAVQLLANKVKKSVNAEGINLGMNNGGAAGQVVFHAHMHVIPRYGNDGFKQWEHKKYNDNSEMKEYEQKIKKEMIN